MKTNNKKLKLPSNRIFGFFFSLVFLILSIFFSQRSEIAFFIFISTSIILFFITILKAEILEPLNKIWMNLGMLIGSIFNPIVMALIFFLIFTPISILMKIFGRDELFLRARNKSSYWTNREKFLQSNSFKNQF